jgi:hypothetical protein
VTHPDGPTGPAHPDGDGEATDHEAPRDDGTRDDGTRESETRDDGRRESETRDDATRDGEAARAGETAAREGSESRELAERTGPPSAVARHGSPPRPPRRTGVFLDPDDLREHVGGLLRAILGGYEVDAFGNYTFTHEGARVFVTVGISPMGPTVGVFSVTNLGVELSPDLARFLLTTNHTLGFGSFSYDLDNHAVWLRHTLHGTTLDGPELQSAVAEVATTAAKLDHPIRDRFGGRTFADAPDDVQRGVEPPTSDPDGARPPNASGYL